MQILIVIIEKDGDTYTGRCPNLIGVSVTGKSRDEVESAIIEAIETKLTHLYTQNSSRRVTVARGNFEETIQCVHKFDQPFIYYTSGVKRVVDKCERPAAKNGLCWMHWRKMYGHAVGNKINLDGCPLCGETDQDILRNWESPCPVKKENPNWEAVLEERKKAKQSKKLKEDREIRLKSHQKYLRCAAVKRNGSQCTSLADQSGLCNLHWKVKFSHKFSYVSGQTDRECKLCGRRETASEWLHPSHCSKNKG